MSLVSRLMHSPTRHHLEAAKRILRCIRRTSNYGIWYYPDTDFNLVGFIDNDVASSLGDRNKHN